MIDIIPRERKKAPLPVAVFLSTLLTIPMLSSCGGGSRTSAPPAPVNDTVGRPVNNPGQPQAKKGLSTGQKVGITLVGAAALYYLYRQHQNSQKEGAQGKYYLSKNGRVYYRDAQGKPQWVSPPSGGVQVPESQAQQYQDFQGYNGRTTGRTLTDVAPAQ
ncbi:MAG: hypothetical protein DSM106950_39670 [Stigonema ocellatum SAG 48.90 = DSM 106950]|nr:hypothetical protein [Stigonema ocellatum SAG 48.90 = DSM 106950]